MKTSDRLRIRYIYYFFIFLFLILTCRIVYLQVFRKNFFQQLAQSQYYRLIPLEGRRGKIFDTKNRVIATAINSYSIFADPSLIKSPTDVASTLSLHLNVPYKQLYDRLSRKKRFVWLKRKVSWLEKEKIKSFKIKGVGSIREGKRFYPQEALAASLLGIVDIDNKGLDGLELFYDDYLRGKNGWTRVLQDSSSREVLISPQVIAPKEGSDVTITIDAQIQYWVENYLQEIIKKFGAKEGSVVVMNARNGEVLALANYPFFNPNNLEGYSVDSRRNRAVCDMFEPGSVFKVVTLLASIESNKFSDTTPVFCENGSFKIPGSTLHDWKPYGQLTFKEVFKKSSNIGVAKIANTVGKTAMYNYMKRLGLGAKTGIDLPGEVSGVIKPLNAWSKTSGYIMPIGQEVGVNLVQLVRMLAVVANGGYLVKPHVVKSINSDFFSKNTAIERKRVVSEAVAQRAKDILLAVVDDGTGALARIEGVRIGGKTGTAQQFDPKIGRYSPTDYRASFIGFVSSIEPPIVIGVTVYEPTKSHFGGVVAAPLFKKIAEKTIKYLEGENVLSQKDAPAYN
ncbi:MAG: penicillin-binding protein 2 [Candidatus Omnitrophica bacterium]|nr:penicillin-binding protein 2 [Candidatus Omnitrophota bacterium]